MRWILLCVVPQSILIRSRLGFLICGPHAGRVPDIRQQQRIEEVLPSVRKLE